MRKIETDIKNNFPHLREQKSKEIYFYNSALFDMYVDFIKSHNLFVKEIFIKPEEKKTVVKIVKKMNPPTHPATPTTATPTPTTATDRI